MNQTESQDKWGPAACIEVGPVAGKPDEKVFKFFGWASE